MVRAISFITLIAWVACAAPEPSGRTDRRQIELTEARKIAACAAALDTVSPEAEKSYRAALATVRGAVRQ